MSCWYDGHLNLFRLLKHNATDSVAYKNRSLFLTVLEAGRPRSGSRCQHTGFWGRDELISRVLLIRALISFMQPSPLWPNYLPRTPYLIPSHLKLGFQHMNFGETQTFRSHHGMRLTKSKIEWLNQSIISQRGDFADTLTYPSRPVHLMCPAQNPEEKEDQYLQGLLSASRRLTMWEPDGEWGKKCWIIFILAESKLPPNPGVNEHFLQRTRWIVNNSVFADHLVSVAAI